MVAGEKHSAKPGRRVGHGYWRRGRCGGAGHFAYRTSISTFSILTRSCARAVEPLSLNATTSMCELHGLERANKPGIANGGLFLVCVIMLLAGVAMLVTGVQSARRRFGQLRRLRLHSQPSYEDPDEQWR